MIRNGFIHSISVAEDVMRRHPSTATGRTYSAVVAAELGGLLVEFRPPTSQARRSWAESRSAAERFIVGVLGAQLPKSLCPSEGEM